MDKQYRSKLIQYRKALGGKHAATERRNFTISVDTLEEHRSAEGGASGWRFRGLASRTEVPYEVQDAYGTFTETIKAGAFNTTLAENPRVSFLINHAGLPLAATQSGTMRLWESERGLEVEAELAADDPMSQHVMSAVKRGDTDQMSFGFRVGAGGQSWDDDMTERQVTILNLHRGDVSIVTEGANPYTEAAMVEDSEREHEDEDEDDYDGHDTEEEILTLMQYTI